MLEKEIERLRQDQVTTRREMENNLYKSINEKQMNNSFDQEALMRKWRDMEEANNKEKQLILNKIDELTYSIRERDQELNKLREVKIIEGKPKEVKNLRTERVADLYVEKLVDQKEESQIVYTHEKNEFPELSPSMKREITPKEEELDNLSEIKNNTYVYNIKDTELKKDFEQIESNFFGRSVDKKLQSTLKDIVKRDYEKFLGSKGNAFYESVM